MSLGHYCLCLWRFGFAFRKALWVLGIPTQNSCPDPDLPHPVALFEPPSLLPGSAHPTPLSTQQPVIGSCHFPAPKPHAYS